MIVFYLMIGALLWIAIGISWLIPDRGPRLVFQAGTVALMLCNLIASRA